MSERSKGRPDTSSLRRWWALAGGSVVAVVRLASEYWSRPSDSGTVVVAGGYGYPLSGTAFAAISGTTAFVVCALCTYASFRMAPTRQRRIWLAFVWAALASTVVVANIYLVYRPAAESLYNTTTTRRLGNVLVRTTETRSETAVNLFLTVPVATLLGGLTTALFLGASSKRTRVIASMLAYLGGGVAATTIGYYGAYVLRAVAIDLFEHLGAPTELGAVAGMFVVGWISLYIFGTIGGLAAPRRDMAGTRTDPPSTPQG